MNIISYRFFHSLRWGAIESAIYQLLFVAHHAALFALCPASTYGMAGILFSALFTTIGLCNLGLDLLLAPEIASWSQSKADFKAFVLQHVPPTSFAIATGIAITGLWWGSSHTLVWIIMSGALLLESVRKTLRTMLRLVANNRTVAFIELVTFVCYMTMVWIWYWVTGHFTLLSIFLPLVIVGFISTLALLLCAMTWYATLPATSLRATLPAPLSSRMPLITHQAISTLLSPNILVLLCSLRLEITHIGSVKLISTVVHSLALILNKTFANATAVFYATQKLSPLPNTNPEHVLGSAFSTPFTMLISIMTLGLVGAYLSGAIISTTLLFVLGLSLSTCYLVTYEQLFISHSATTALLAPNITTLMILVALSQLPLALSSSSIMGAFLVLRIGTAILLSHIANQRWHIAPLLHPRSFFIMGSLGVITILITIIKSLAV